jgi:hypothetical protein
MPIGTPFHSRTSALCTSHNWRTWSGYLVASSYDGTHGRYDLQPESLELLSRAGPTKAIGRIAEIFCRCA